MTVSKLDEALHRSWAMQEAQLHFDSCAGKTECPPRVESGHGSAPAERLLVAESGTQLIAWNFGDAAVQNAIEFDTPMRSSFEGVGTKPSNFAET